MPSHQSLAEHPSCSDRLVHPAAELQPAEPSEAHDALAADLVEACGRLGIGRGDVVNETTGDFDGPAFVDAARLCDVAEPRQVLCTDLVSRASRAHANEDLGPRRLDDVEGPRRGRSTRVPPTRVTDRVVAGLAVSVLGPLPSCRRPKLAASDRLASAHHSN